MPRIGYRVSRGGRVLLPTAAIGVAAFIAAATPICAVAGESGHQAVAKIATITIDHHAFAPATLTIAAGTTVTWKNSDDSPHTVREKEKVFGSGPLDTGDSFSYTFATPGEFPYFCSLHPFMTGRVVVEPAGKSS